MSRSAPDSVLSMYPPNGTNISERMQSKLSSIPIKIPGSKAGAGANGTVNGEKKVFRVSSPVDYHATFKWNDAAKDNVSANIKRLYDDEHENKKVFPDQGSYEVKEQQFFDEMEADDIRLMDDSVLEQEIDSLIQSAPPEEEGDRDDLLSLSSEGDEDEIAIRSTSPLTVGAIPEHDDINNEMNGFNGLNGLNPINPMNGMYGDQSTDTLPSTQSTLKGSGDSTGDSNSNSHRSGQQMFYSPKDDKASITASASSSGVSSASPFIADIATKRDEIMDHNEHNEENNTLSNPSNPSNLSNAPNQSQSRPQRLRLNDTDTVGASQYDPECQTFIHFTASHQNILSDPSKNSLSIFLQSDSYFADENDQRDRRKKEQDDEAKRRRQREQDVMRGNDVVSIQKSLNSSGMAASGGSDNAPLDGSGNKVVLPSTGIILDATRDKSIADFFVEQQGQCFSCGDHLGSAQMARQCYYTQRLYCTLCMDGTVSSCIPSRLIHDLDTRKYPISSQSKQHLDSMFDVPAVPLSKMELPSWYIPTESANVTVLSPKSTPQRNRQSSSNGGDINAKYCKLSML